MDHYTTPQGHLPDFYLPRFHEVFTIYPGTRTLRRAKEDGAGCCSTGFDGPPTAMNARL